MHNALTIHLCLTDYLAGWPVVAVCTGFDNRLSLKPGSSGKPVPGFDVRCLLPRHHGESSSSAAAAAPHGSASHAVPEAPENTEGELVLKLPLPPGCLQTLYRNPARFKSSYLAKYPGYYDLGDSGYIDDDGYVFIMERTGMACMHACVSIIHEYHAAVLIMFCLLYTSDAADE